MTSQLKTVALAMLALGSFMALKPATAGTLFAKAELDPSKIVAVASPYAGGSAHQLLIVEQIASSKACWSESKSGSITLINPLLSQFDFTGICGRSIDSNGYSVRMGDEDLGWKYSLRVVKRGGDMLLIGSPTADRSLPELQIGRVNGTTDGFAKINLNSGWRMTKRSYNGQNTGHIYLTNDRSLNSVIATRPTTPTQPPVSTLPKPTTPTQPPVSTLPKPPAKPSIPIPVPKPGTTTPPVATKPSPTLPKPPVVTTPPVTSPKPTKPANPGDFIVPTIDVFR